MAVRQAVAYYKTFITHISVLSSSAPWGTAFTAFCLPINLFMLFFSILFITSFPDTRITRLLNHSKNPYKCQQVPLFVLDVDPTTNHVWSQSSFDCSLGQEWTAIMWIFFMSDHMKVNSTIYGAIYNLAFMSLVVCMIYYRSHCNTVNSWQY